MDLPKWSRKRPLLHGYENEPPLYTKKCFSSLTNVQDRCEADGSERGTHHVRQSRSRGHPYPHEACVNEEAEHLNNNKHLAEQMSCWADTQLSVKKVMDSLMFRQASSDIFLDYSANKKFLEFHRDITEECGAEEKQHSWAVIEKQEEIIMYGPYYPNYSNGEHSEDIIITQTQELMESETVSEDWKVYVFTMNSPCLARNTDPCMLKLIHKAQEWWSVYGVTTYIGYVRCWGFKGNKENLFRDINYQQVDCINQTEDYEGYVNTAQKTTELSPLDENQYSAVKHHLESRQVNFPLITHVQGQDWKNFFKSMHSVFEGEPEEEKTVLTQEMDTVIEAAQAQLSGISGSFKKCLEIGREFVLDCTFSQQVSDALQNQMRLIFQQCWQEMVHDKYAEFIREKLTDDFNRCTVELFIKDIVKFTKEYLQIGRIQFPDNDAKAPHSVD